MTVYKVSWAGAYGSEKRKMAETCVVLGLRVLKFIYDTVEAHGADLIMFRAEQLKANWQKTVEKRKWKVSPVKPTEAEWAEELKTYLPSFLSSVTVGTIIKIANAIGCEDLAPTIDSVLKDGGTRQLIRLATKLEHFSEFPTSELLTFERDYLDTDALLPSAVMRRFIVRRFHLFPVREELKRQVLVRFKISEKPFRFLPQKGSGI